MADHAVIAWLHPGLVRAEFCASLLGLAAYGATVIDAVLARGSGPTISIGRNRVCHEFLTQYQTPWLLMCDTDMVFRPDALDRLLDAADPDERPVVSALYHGTDEQGGPRPLLTGRRDTAGGPVYTQIASWPAGEVIRVAATGAGFLLVHRTALEKVAATSGLPGAPWFRQVPLDAPLRIMGEDTVFFLTCADAGIPVYVHTGVQCGHMKARMLGQVT